MVDDTFAPDGGKEAARRKRRRRLLAAKPQPYKRPICIHFPIPMFMRIKKMAQRNDLSFTAQVVMLCARALERDK